MFRNIQEHISYMRHMVQKSMYCSKSCRSWYLNNFNAIIQVVFMSIVKKKKEVQHA